MIRQNPIHEDQSCFGGKLVMFLLGIILLGMSPSQLQAKLTEAQLERSIKRGTDALANAVADRGPGEAGVGLMALMIADVDPDDKRIQTAFEKILRTCNGGNFNPGKSKDSTYEAAVILMAMVGSDMHRQKTDPPTEPKFQAEIAMLTNWMVTHQLPNGAWDYPGQTNGDTSQTQYAILSLWEAIRSGQKVDVAVFQRAARWHTSRQTADGGFAYKPVPKQQEGSRHTLTAGGCGSLLICRMFMFPDAKDSTVSIQGGASKSKKPKEESSQQSVLEAADEVEADLEASITQAAQPKISNSDLSAINTSAGKALRWLDTRFTVSEPVPKTWPVYYLYSLERAMALANQPNPEMLGEHAWFEYGATHLISTQAESGLWKGRGGDIPTSAFALMFLLRATDRKLGTRINRKSDGGILATGRGLPDDPSDIINEGGKVKKRKMTGPVDELLKILEDPQNANFFEAQEALVEKVQLKDPRALVGKTAELLNLAAVKNDEVRRTAMWALGRSHDITVVPVLIEGLNDPNFDVVVEARNALRYLSKKIDGYGLPVQPTDDQRKKAVRSWKEWYLTVRPYEERDDLLTLPQ